MREKVIHKKEKNAHDREETGGKTYRNFMDGSVLKREKGT